MKLGTFMGQLNSAVQRNEAKSLSEVFDRFMPMGLSYVDVSSGDARCKGEPTVLAELLKGKGVSVASVFHLFAFDDIGKTELESLKETSKRQFELCRVFDAKLYMPVPVVNFPHKDQQAFLDARKRFAEYLHDAVIQGKQYGVQTVIENFSDRKNPNATIEDIAYLLKEVPDLKYALDCGNFWFGGDDVLTATDLFLDKTVHVHLKDLVETPTGRLKICGRRGESVPIGKGEIPTKAVLQKLQASGYEGGLTVEINHNENLMAEIGLSLKNIKKMLEA